MFPTGRRAAGSAHEHDQRIRAHVRGRDHVVQRLDGEDLRLVEDLHVHRVEAAAEALLAGSEHDTAAIAKRYLLLAVRTPDMLHMPGHQFVLCEAAHRLERLIGGSGAVRGPQHLEVGLHGAQEERGGADGERLAHLTAYRYDSAALAARIQAVLTLAEHEIQQSLLP